MKLIKISACVVAFFLATPIWATTTTIWGGFEDTIRGDSDYNDLVFSISGTDLTLKTGTGQWFAENTVVLGTSGTPFWNNLSFDSPGTGMNIGYCIYGGGACNGGTGVDPGADYLATALGGNVSDVTFSVGGDVTEQVTISISADSNLLGWEAAGGGPITLFTTNGPNSFTPGGDFVLVGNVTPGNANYTSDGSAQFAFFGPAAATPEPSSLMLLGSGLLGMAGVARRRLGRR